MNSSTRFPIVSAVTVLAACSSSGTSVVGHGPIISPIELACAAPSGRPTDTWRCPEAITLACTAPDSVIFTVESPAGARCDEGRLEVVAEESLTPGTHTVVLRDDEGEELCSSEVTVAGSAIVDVEPQVISLWPPNHKLHEIALEDCVAVSGGCGLGWVGQFVWASSDEPVNATGDGNHAPDIVVSDDCQRISLRSERRGPSDGRVYNLGVRVIDSAGAVHESGCSVVVDHDRGGSFAVDSGDAYRVVLDGSQGGPACNGPLTPPLRITPPLDATP
ncbi:MAG: hypothetical protein ABW321_25630 [Polyangiales bacterium]